MSTKSLSPSSASRPLLQRSEHVDPFMAFRHEMNRLFDDVFGGFGFPIRIGSQPTGMPTAVSAPQIDVSETGQDIRLTAELPGIDEDDVEVTLADDMLTIRGEKKSEREEDKGRNYHLVERSYGAFSRALRLPFAVDPNEVQAAFKNGVLTVTIPKPKEVQEKVHKIQVKKEPGATGVIISPADRAAAGDKPSVASDVPSQDTASKATAA
jgi:HSP20 family protein